MIPLSHPLVQDYLRLARQRPADSTDVRICLNDRMQDADVHPGIGEPGGLDLPTCCWWYARCEDADEPALREALATVDELIQPDHPAHRVADGELTTRRVNLVRSMRVSSERSIIDAKYEAILQLLRANLSLNWVEAIAKVAFRDLRRRVLALYPEVRCEARAEISQYEYPKPPPLTALVADFFDANGFRLDLDPNPNRNVRGRCAIHRAEDRRLYRWIYTQMLAAPDLIAPEGPNLEVDASGNWQELRGRLFNRELELPTSGSSDFDDMAVLNPDGTVRRRFASDSVENNDCPVCGGIGLVPGGGSGRRSWLSSCPRCQWADSVNEPLPPGIGGD